MLHASSAIRYTRWEGISYKQAIAYLQDLLSLDEHPIHLGLNAK